MSCPVYFAQNFEKIRVLKEFNIIERVLRRKKNTKPIFSLLNIL